MTMPLDNGPTLLRPLIESLIELFKQAAHQYGYVPLLDTVKVRREIFKLQYDHDLFGLNSKADAFEAYDFLLTSIHSWIQNSAQALKNTYSPQADYDEATLGQLSSVSCSKKSGDKSSCFIHEGYFLPKSIQRVCISCQKQATEVSEQDGNLFAETISVPEILTELDALAEVKKKTEAPIGFTTVVVNKKRGKKRKNQQI